MADINGIPYVESSDLVSAYPAVSQSLAQEVSDQLASKLDLAGGKILQIVRATDSTNRSTTSTSFVDVTGMSVTITPQKSDSAILIIASFKGRIDGSNGYGVYQITDSSNNAISGAQDDGFGDGAGSTMVSKITMLGYATPATTSATTYKLRFRIELATSANVRNAESTGQMFALEISA